MNRDFDKAVHDTMALLDAISAGYDARVPASLAKLATETRDELLRTYDLQRAEERRGDGWENAMRHLAQVWRDAATALVQQSRDTGNKGEAFDRALSLDRRAKELDAAVLRVIERDAAEAPRMEEK